MLDRILLFIMKRRLKRYKKNCEWYHQQGATSNWYDEIGIPELEKELKEFDNKIKKG